MHHRHPVPERGDEGRLVAFLCFGLQKGARLREDENLLSDCVWTFLLGRSRLFESLLTSSRFFVPFFHHMVASKKLY